MNENSLKNIRNQADAIAVMADERKKIFLKEFAFFAEREEFVYPNIAKLLKTLDIPYHTYLRWKSEDMHFKEAFDAIEAVFLDELEKTLVEASTTKWGVAYAISVLRAKRRGVWGDRLEHSGQIANIQLVSGIRSSEQVDEHTQPAVIVSDGDGNERALGVN